MYIKKNINKKRKPEPMKTVQEEAEKGLQEPQKTVNEFEECSSGIQR
jgi:hypothetical protein